MKRLSTKLSALTVLLLFCQFVSAQSITAQKRKITIVKIDKAPVIDGVLDEPEWKNAAVADKFVQFQPTPFLPEANATRSEVFLTYNNDGVYIGAIMHEPNRDSIAKELAGRDGFGNNDFFGVVFDTYQDKLNGFEYFVTPLNEQWDSKVSQGGNEDFSWNAVWYSAVKLTEQGWTLEMFLPYSAIRFGKKPVQDWGFNIVRQRRKSGQKFFWEPLDPNVNGFLTQEGTIAGFSNIKPPMRLQFSPYLSGYYIHNDDPGEFEKSSQLLLNGGMDVKYGINQAFTLDMTLVPDFGQVQSDNVSLNLSPFEQQFSDNRPFFTEGVELFSKGDLFYSRRIGGQPLHYSDAYDAAGNDNVIRNPEKSKLINATKVSGRTQRGLGVGILNAVTKPQYAVIEDAAKNQRKFLTDPLTNYNVFVLDQTLKHNSSVSLVNTSVLREGSDYDATVTAGLFDFYDKKNTWNYGGNATVSNRWFTNETITGYAHELYFGKASGKFNFQVSQTLQDKNFNKNDLGYFNFGNVLNHFGRVSYNWNTPGKWYNRVGGNINGSYRRLLTPMDMFKGKDRMYQGARVNFNAYAQLKKLHEVGFYFGNNFRYNDFYEPRSNGRVFHSGGDIYVQAYFESNDAKKVSYNVNLGHGRGGYFKSRRAIDLNTGLQVRFNSKFLVRYNVSVNDANNSTGWARTYYANNPADDRVIFARRNLNSVENGLFVKYNFTNRMGLTLQSRHSWSKVNPQELLQLDQNGDLFTPATPVTDNLRQNFNYFSADALYSWQFAQGSFFTAAWKDIGSGFSRSFEKNYVNNLFNTVGGDQYTSFSVKVIWFLDYVEIRRKMKNRNGKAVVPKV